MVIAQKIIEFPSIWVTNAEEYAARMAELQKAAAQASQQIALYGSAWLSVPIGGRRRHGLVKHARDLKRAQMKKEAV